MRSLLPFLSFIALLLTACGPDLPDAVAVELAALPDRVDFNQHIRPILSDRCWSCHGPDAGARQAGLRLDTEATAFAALEGSGARAFVAGHPGRSEAVRRILSDDPAVVMPPPESKLTLTDRERALLVRWVENGAEWKDHWAFLAVEDPAPPPNPTDFPAARTPVDNFINARLSETGLAPADRAQPELLIRRLYQDLTGLPPRLEDVDAWLADPSEAAYTALVDRLMTTDAFAERLTMEWLDVARYADSHGMHADGYRTSYPYRDWVISAFRRNLPYDEFIRYQLAGDLIDAPTRESRLATAFLRMHPMTAEGGAIDEEFRLSYVFDRVNTVATGLLGLTLDCARCHDHKFDPLSQEEYYRFSAFFNTVDELGMTGDDGDFGPYLAVADPETEALIDRLDAEARELDEQRAAVTVGEEALAAFNAELTRSERPVFELPFDRFDDGSVDGRAAGTASFSIEPDPERGPVGVFDHGYDLVNVGEQGRIEMHEPLSATLWINTSKRDSTKEQTLLCNSAEKNQKWKGIDFFLDRQNRLTVSFAHVQPTDLIEVQSFDSLRTGRWYQVGFSYDGSGRASGVTLYVDGQPIEGEVLHDGLTGNFLPVPCYDWEKCDRKTMRVGASWRAFTGDNALFLGKMDDLRIYHAVVSPLTVARQFGEAPPGRRNVEQHLIRRQPTYAALTERLRDNARRRQPIGDTVTNVMVMEEMRYPRKTYVLDRGAYDAPRQEVRPGTPQKVLPWSTDYARDRNGLVDWLLAPENPLTARVVVNRYWQLLFGQGLVATPHDFGSQGSLPTHPQLLDHLASRFREDWDVRQLLRTIVLSDTYRRSSTPTPEQREADPDNLLLARGARYRLAAELIRDNALAASGLLNTHVGGASVKPYQPEGLWIEKSSFSHVLLRYVPDHGDKLYRRSMYTFIRRTSPPPFLTTFDAGSRDICLVKRSETNTPLQALNLLNDPQFVEAARVLAARVQREGGTSTNAQLRRAFRLVTGRRAAEDELTVLQSLYGEELERFRENGEAAARLLAVGEYPAAEDLPPAHTAALASVGNMLLSLDAAYVKY